ncbi:MULTISPECIES: LysR family transcriptional regulator [unclassified Achromobacter]|uniref:LysR family transcriptional regulator n=1 Tax=unclassified Achromobacter TaxID=2626865 RepID=UPI000B51B88F|nr:MULTISPECIES: LysR family transcriptional regulator [unclassified Achromobacter]OWT76820.1 LysR family transcriptional regulator [Achromobacter sp. HZ28]OWT77700.1 LysR family transcriptional regulator [Achromobacter sp. HZ34]
MNRAQTTQLMVFVSVAELGSFRRAAEQLGIAPSAVSHAVSALEQSLGVRLLARTTRSTRPTDEGARLLARVSGPFADIAAGLQEAAEQGGPPSGPLRVTMAMAAAEDLILRRLPEFCARYPLIELDIRADDNFEDIVRSGCDAGVRLGESLEADMIAVRASGPRRNLIVGTPAYFAAHPPPRHPTDLARHNCIRRRFSSGRVYRWELQKRRKAINVEVQGTLILPQQTFMRQAALDSLGLAFLFEHLIADDLEAGRLISVMDDWCPSFDGFYIYYPSRRQMRPALRAFVDFFQAPSRPAPAAS